jgi:MFS family permease
MEVHETPALVQGRPRFATLSLIRRNPHFRLLFMAQVVSFSGDWFLFVALAGLVFELTHSPALVAALYAAQTVPFAIFTFLGGPLADRVNRQVLMIAADVVRGALAGGFFLIHRPSQVWMVYVLAGLIAALGALFEPASMAAVPNLVEKEDLGTANVLAGAVWGSMLAVGSAMGGLVVAAFGRGAGYIGDAASFLVSAALVSQIRRPFSEAREPEREHPGFVEASREAIDYARRDHRVLSLLAVKGGFGLGSGVVALLPVLALQAYHAGDKGTGILFAFRGLGVVIGPFLVRRVAREDRLSAMFWTITGAFVVYGLSYAFVPWMGTIWLAGIFVFVGHFGGGAQWTLSSYGLQVLVPDRIRGRIFAFDEGFITLTLAVSATLAGILANVFGVRVVMLGLAAVTLAYSLVWTLATTRVRRSLRPEPSAGPEG